MNPDTQLRQKLTEMKEAKDAIDNTLRGDQPGSAKGGSRRKRTRKPEEPEEPMSDDSETSVDNWHLEPTPLAVQDAAYADEADDVEDLGFMIGRMRIGERIGGHYRPRAADEVCYSTCFYRVLFFMTDIWYRSCFTFNRIPEGLLPQHRPRVPPV